MRRLVIAAIAGGGIYAALGSAFAVDVDFNGVVNNNCSLTVNSNGTLDVSADGGILGSEEGAGSAATIEVVSFGANTLTVGAPNVTNAPGAYDNSGEVVEVRYVGAGGLAAVNQAYTSTSSNNSIGATSSSSVSIFARINNANSFPTGNYTVRTTVTCSP
ncbi:MAG: hypothetical protein AAF371_11505 [Pseudomonadota bacterium]